MEVLLPMTSSTSPDFVFPKTTTPSPYPSAPSSPKPFGNLHDLYYAYASAPTSPNRASSIYSYYSDDFNFSTSLEEASQENLISPADELFHEGHIRPLKNPHGSCPPQGEARGSNNNGGKSSDIGHGLGSRTKTHTNSASTNNSKSRKWRLKDLFLFRSASEGRATGRGSKDLLRKYTLLPSFSSSFEHKDAKVKSLKSEDGSSSMKLHYMENRAKSEEEKKKVPLPYHRNTLFGCLHFNPAVKSIVRGFGNGNSNSSNRGK